MPARRFKAPRVGSLYLYLVFFLSGIAGLGYEIVWIRMFAIGLGHEIPSMLAVLAAFFGGIAVGAWTLDKPVSKSLRPGHYYVVLEVVIAVWALALIFLIPRLNDVTPTLIGVRPSPLRHFGVSFLLPFLTLLPATAAMGGTLPAMDRLFSRLQADGHSVGGLYGVNTFGAVVGTLATTFVLAQLLGFRLTLIVLAIVNLVCAAAVLVGPAREEQVRPPVQARILDLPGSRRLYLTVFATGLLGIGYEVLAVRVMAQILENTVYSFASALTAYLVASALGASVYQAHGRRVPYRNLLAHLVQGVSLSCIVGVFVVSQANVIYTGIQERLGVTFGSFVAAEIGLGLCVFFLPSFFMGALFSHLAQGARRETGGVGRALALNTLGSTLAPIVFAVLLLRWIGAMPALVAVALSYLLLSPRVKLIRLAPAAIPILILPLLPEGLDLIETPPNGKVLAHREGVMAAVTVVTDAEGHRYLKVNNRFHMGGTAGAFGERRQAHIPLLLHPRPKTALFLGLGSGITMGAARAHRELAAEGVELVPEVVELLDYFADHNSNLRQSAGPALFVADARRYVRAVDAEYDVIVADLYHPARDGAGSLYTEEHFRAIRDRLAPGGLVCQWLPLYQLDGPAFRTILRTFLEVFPNARGHLAYFNVATPALALVATLEPVRYPTDWYRSVRRPVPRQALVESGLGDDLALFGTFAASREALVKVAGIGPLNVDDRPLITFGAPRIVYGERKPPFALLTELLEVLRPDSRDLLLDPDGSFARRLDAYLRARDLYLRAEILLAENHFEAAVGQYLASIRASADFLAAYARLLWLAEGQTDPVAARALLRALEDANPSRPEAGLLLEKLSPVAVPPR